MDRRKKKVKAKSKSVSSSRKTGTIWLMAVDPFSGVDLEPVWHLVEPLSAQLSAKVRAAYVLAPASMNWTGDFSGPWMKKYEPIAEAKLTEKLPDQKLTKEIIKCRQPGQAAAVKALLNHAHKIKAQYLIIATHARKGLERIAMGSFAESVILAAKIPVLVINPERKIPEKVRKILIPTDLSKKSEKFIATVADDAKRLGAEIVLFHKQPDPLDPIIQQGVYSLGGGWVSVQSFIDDELEQKNKQVQKLEEQLRKRHINVSHVIDSSPEGLIDSIERAAKDSGADMVSVLTQTGSWGAVILGSVARGLVRNSSLPVLVRR
jgi:nucleotide-binding universal stress UspA family protein